MFIDVLRYIYIYVCVDLSIHLSTYLYVYTDTCVYGSSHLYEHIASNTQKKEEVARMVDGVIHGFHIFFSDFK